MKRDKFVLFIVIVIIIITAAYLYKLLREHASNDPKDVNVYIENEILEEQEDGDTNERESHEVSPTPAGELSLGIDITPVTETGDGSVAEAEVSEGEAVRVQEISWDDGIISHEDLTSLADVVAGSYAEKNGALCEGRVLTESECETLENPYVYTVDKYGFLYVRVCLSVEGKGEIWVQGKIGYAGLYLHVYDLEVIK